MRFLVLDDFRLLVLLFVMLRQLLSLFLLLFLLLSLLLCQPALLCLLVLVPLRRQLCMPLLLCQPALHFLLLLVPLRGKLCGRSRRGRVHVHVVRAARVRRVDAARQGATEREQLEGEREEGRVVRNGSGVRQSWGV